MATPPPLAQAPAGADADAWEQACAAVRAYCGWHIAPSVTETVTVDGSGGPLQTLPTLRLTALSSITNDGTAVTDPQWSEAGMVRADCVTWWTWKFRGVTADITHGHDVCPPEIVGVLAEAASRGAAGSAVNQVGQVRMGGVSGTPGAAAFVLERTAVLDRYKLPPRP